MQFPKSSFSASRMQLLLATALWISLLPNLASLQRFWTAPSAGNGLQTIAFVLGGWLLVTLTTFSLLLALGIVFWGRSVKLLCAIALIAAATLGYFTLFFGVQFDKTMFMNIAQTHTSEALELMSLRMAIWVAVVGVVPAIAISMVPLRAESGWWRAMWSPLAVWFALLVLCLGIALMQYSRYASAIRNKAVTFHTIAPSNFVAAATSYVYSQYEQKIVRDARGVDAHQRYAIAKPRLIVFVLGETARAQNHGLNGYERDTTPRMRQENALYFADTESCGTATAISLPCIFSGLGRANFSLNNARSIETLIDVVLHANIRTIWRDNDSGCKGVCDRADVVDLTNSDNPRWCSEKGECHDEILLDGLEEKLRSESRDTFVVLHLKGSHGPAYYKRYPQAFEKFTPTCKTNDLSACDRQSLVNAYDNTIVYTDHVLGEVTTLLKKLSDQFAPAMFYASDHGESLGENGMYLHGLPYAVAPKEQTRVPMLAWLSPQFVQMERWNAACLLEQTKKQRSHDNIYSTLLGLLEIETHEYKHALDIFEDCDTPQQPSAKR
jgi:lipid A ethanolaminephosphotransferase